MHRILPLKRAMKTRFQISSLEIVTGLLLSGGLMMALPSLHAQATSNPQQQTAPVPKPKQPESNPFPEDTNTVPVLPSADAAPAPDTSDMGNVPLPSGDGDPVKSPDDASPASSESGSSSSNSGMDNLLRPPPDEEQGGKHRRLEAPDQPHTESAKEDESVGSYYLEQKNWKAALSRFESAVVLDPENPEVYWGLAEAHRHMGDFVQAKTNYLKVMEYDPDSRHGKDAKKLLKEPEIANAKATSATASAPRPQPPSPQP
jgi:tetratricopeptide (TPR) repeat protein